MMKKTNESINIPEDDDYTLQPILKSPEFPRQGEYTVEDYRALPDDGRRFELIDGYLIEIEAPYWVHQEVQMQLVMQLLECLKQSDHDCEIFVAPLDVRIDEDDRTVVEPDIIVLCNYDKPRDHDVMGAPDFVIEILSESNRAHDLIRKYRKYKNAGVREYWIVDPRDRVVRVHYFEKDEPEEVYPFDAIVEIRISERKCKIDFAVINRKLEQYQSGRRKYGKYPQLTPDRSIILRESLAAYGTSLDVDDDYTLKPVPRTAEFPRQGTYTIEDYMNLPDDGRRFELIDGYLIEMNSPTELHQTILAELSYQIYTCIKQKNRKHCKLLFAPFDVRLDMDNRTMVQPDLLVVCGEKAVNMHAGEGAPDFVIEILSDSNRAHDLVRKYRKYKNAGVREYWIVDPKFRLVRVFCFEKGGSEQVYPFDGEIPVGLSEGSCSVDFSAVYEAIRNYYE
ncbi:MAG: Uma2 family endonuclease [Eubacterium sp.]|nr:Uma2 family endonuclease [Eubacterium sp.]